MNCAETGKNVLKIESKAIDRAIDRLGDSFTRSVELIYDTPGRVVVTGMGKSGLIGKKIAATLTSTGTPAVFLHPSEALHGDIGIIAGDDVVLALSTSGETREVVRLINFIKRIGVKMIALVGNISSTLANESDFFIDCSVEEEACPIGLVPTTSTTLTLAVGDAISIALMEKKGFKEEDFRFNHPGGSIGKKLLKVRHLMHVGDELPRVSAGDLMIDVVRIINSKKFGIAIVVSKEGEVLGIITDGDVRRQILKFPDFLNRIASESMTINPQSIEEDNLAVEALQIMEDKLITSLVVLSQGKLTGLVHLHDLWRTEMI